MSKEPFISARTASNSADDQFIHHQLTQLAHNMVSRELQPQKILLNSKIYLSAHYNIMITSKFEYSLLKNMPLLLMNKLFNGIIVLITKSVPLLNEHLFVKLVFLNGLLLFANLARHFKKKLMHVPFLYPFPL